MKLNSKPQLNLEHSSTIFGLMFVGMIVVVASILLSKQLVSSIRFTNRVLSRYNATEETLAQNVQTLPELKANYEILQREGPASDKILRALPTDVNFPGLATLMEQLSAVSNVRLTTIIVEEAPEAAAPATIVQSGPSQSVGDAASEAQSTEETEEIPPIDPSDTPQTVNFSVGVSGRYTDILKFFSALETAIRPMKVTEVNISGEGASLNAELKVVTYYQAASTFSPQKEVVR